MELKVNLEIQWNKSWKEGQTRSMSTTENMPRHAPQKVIIGFDKMAEKKN